MKKYTKKIMAMVTVAATMVTGTADSCYGR